jgi:phosphorylase kinase alpha/beta subunit
MIVILETLTHRFGHEGQVALGKLGDLLEEVYTTAANWRVWAVVRRAAGLLGKVDGAISESVTDILVSQKSILIGKAYSERSLIVRPLSETELSAKIAEFCRENSGDRVLTQELLIYLGLLIRAEPDLFKDLLTVRVGYLIVLLAADLAKELGVTQDEGYACLLHLSPSEIQKRLREVLASFKQKESLLKEQEMLSADALNENLDWDLEDKRFDTTVIDWWDWRRREGTISRIPMESYGGIWSLLERCEGIVIGDKLDRRNRLDSRLLLEMTSGEKNFAMRVEHLLNRFTSPEYRQLSIETISTLHGIMHRNEHLKVNGYLVLDVIIGHAIRLAYLDSFPERIADYESNKAHAWATFYSRTPSESRRYLVRSFQFLLEIGLDRELV